MHIARHVNVGLGKKCILSLAVVLWTLVLTPRSDAVIYYVNNNSTNGNVYTTNVGNDANPGTNAAAPKATMTNLLATVNLLPGDIVYIDTGTYSNYTVTVTNSGAIGNPIIFIGSTNLAAGGTQINRGSTIAHTWVIEGASDVHLRHLTIRGGLRGVFISAPAERNVISNCVLRNNSRGLFISGSLARNNTLTQSTVANNTTSQVELFGSPSNHITHSVFSGNTSIRFSPPGASLLSFHHNIARVSGAGQKVFDIASSPSFLTSPNYNVYHRQNDAVIGVQGAVTYTSLDDFQKALDVDWQSTSFDPLFADVASLDFHVLSEYGRWDGSGFTNDAVTSRAIDIGNRALAFGNEPPPNGSRINVGRYGNTPEASKSRPDPWLLALTYQDGGTLNISNSVYWTHGNIATTQTVRIELSRDSGNFWEIVQTNLPIHVETYQWLNTNYASSIFARWRVVLESDDSIRGAVDQDFVYRNGPFTYYINNDNTNGNVYTSAPGNDANLGTSAGAPKATLRSLVDERAIQAGDIIYIDTGLYTFSQDQVISGADSGDATGKVIIQGSTNVAAGGTVLRRHGSSQVGIVLDLTGGSYYDIRDITIANAATGIRFRNSTSNSATRVFVSNAGTGIDIDNSTGVVLDQAAVYNCSVNGIRQHTSNPQSQIQRFVAWGNARAGIRIEAGTATVSNSVVVAEGNDAYAYHAATTNSIVGNYNNVYATSNAVLGYISVLGRNLTTLSSWSHETGRERHSLSDEPRFANPSAGDFHPMTETRDGRFIPGVGFNPAWDDVTSPLIDAGDPTWSFGNEKMPNGGRINIGMFGNTTEASVGRTNAWLYVATLRNGGVARGNTTLHWVSGFIASNETVTVRYSPDGGQTWSVLAASVPVTNEVYVWNTTTTNDTPAGVWRVTLDSNTNLFDFTRTFFSVRNANLSIYINNATTNGNVWTTGPGRSTNWVATASRPLDSLPNALSMFTIQPGDTIYVDTGSYSNFVNPVVGRLAGGTAANPVRILGSTNDFAGGTVLYRPSAASTAFGLHVDRTEHVIVSNITLRSGRFGYRINNSSQIDLGRVSAIGTLSNAFHAVFSTNVTIRRSVAAEGLGVGLLVQSVSGARWLNSVIWSNAEGAIVAVAGDLSVSNSVMHAAGAGKRVYWSISNATIRANYNNLRATDNASVARVDPSEARQAIRWQALTSNDLHSLTHNPLFVNPSMGDYHVRSVYGRYDPALQTYVFTDTNISYQIDTGDPLGAFALEPDPNGQRVNIGLYGNTTQASRSDTNAWLVALTMNDGGSIRDTNTIYWVAGGSATGHTVTIQVSVNNGVTWSNVVGGLAASLGEYLWDSTQHPSTPVALWRVVSDVNTNVMGQTETSFSINNGPLTYYVNNNSTNGNVYTSAPGSTNNDGLSAESPLPSVQHVLDRVDLFPGDHIYVDTGTYLMTNGITVGSDSKGMLTNRITIIGSTNYAAGGTVLNFNNLFNGITLNNTEGIAVEHIQIVNARIGVRSLASGDTFFNWVRIRNSGTGFEFDQSTNAMFRHCLVANATTNGLYLKSSPSASWDHGVLWSNRFGVRTDRTAAGSSPADDTVLTFSNSVNAVFGPLAIAYWRGNGTIIANYNNILAENNALVASVPGAIFPRAHYSLYHWRQESGNDRNSLNHDPAFADPGSGDFHLMTQAPGGRLMPGVGWTNDAVTSVLIDAGAPTAAFTNEPSPNGRRINIGLYGATTEASHTPTNSAISAITLRDGGIVQGTTNLLWVARGNATSHFVQIELTVNTGFVWQIIATNIPASAGTYSLNSTLYTNTLLAMWRVRSTNEPSAVGEVTRPFAIRNAPFTFYVNSSTTNGNVYTSAPGLPTHDGLRTNTPMDSIQGILAKWDIEPGDFIYVDTGVYTNDQPIRITQADSGVPYGAERVVIQGSTNELAGGTVLDMGGAAVGIVIEEAAQIDLNHIKIRNAQQGLLVRRSEGNRFAWMEVVGGTTGYGVDLGFNNIFRHCVARNVNGSGLIHATSSNTVWQSGVLWSNQFGVTVTSSTNFSMTGGGAIFQVSNTVVGAFGPNSMAVRRLAGPLESDYNNYYLLDGALAAQDGAVQFLSVARWVRDTGRDRHTLTHDPRFFNAAAADFHPVSQTGRYNVALGTFVPDTNTSVMIDAGAPSADFSLESQPNGGRINIGLYGNHWQASRSPTNSRLTAVAFNDGGRVEGTNGLLVWAAAGNVTGHTVTIAFSYNGGIQWDTIATGIVASSEQYIWDTTQFTSTIKGLWRIISDQELSVGDTNDQFFAVRNQPIPFYVNDSSTNGNVYTTAPGVSTNEGLFPFAPKDSVQGILNQWRVEPGDIIYIDTGIYSNNSAIVFNQFSAGDVSNQLYITLQGSTNTAAGGTIIDRLGSGDAIQLTQAPAIALRHLNLRHFGQFGVLVSASEGARLEHVHTAGGQSGVRVVNTTDTLIRRSSARGATSSGLSVQNATGVQWLNGVLWSNLVGISGRATISNSVIAVFGPDAMAYSYPSTTPVISDYNAVFLSGGAVVAQRSVPGVLPEIYFTLSRYARDIGQDRNSLAYDPLFADPSNGDFHLRSQGGRFLPGFGWTNDAVTSPLIDAGPVSEDFSQESAPNGNRVNIGLYGNTAEASRTPTNAALNVLSLRDGGRTEGQAFLRWLAQGGATSHLVRVQVSSDGGTSWQTLAEDQPASQELFVWDTTISPSSIRGVWRVVSQTDTNVFSQTLPYFAIRNHALSFYVNNASTNGNVYTSVAGHPDNHGATTDQPMDSIQRVLDTWDLEPGDAVYVDTGTYLVESDILIDRFDAWHQLTNLTALAASLPATRVSIIGSTNFVAGGTVLNRVGSGNVISLVTAPGIAIRHITTRNGTIGIRAIASPHGLAEWVRAEKALIGFHIITSDEFQFRHCVARENTARGVFSQSSANVTWQHGVLWSNAVATLLFDGSFTIQNSVIAAFGSNSIGQVRVRGTLTSDYNNMYARDGAPVGGVVPSQSLTGPTNRFTSMRAWNRATGLDPHTLVEDPQFANPAAGDFHLKTTRPGGRYDPFVGVWTNDTEFSRLIDAGNPASPLGDEPDPNGSRVNIGLYGSTPEASLTPTGGWVTAISLKDGGSAEGTMTLNFVAGGTATGHLFYLEYSPLAGFVLEGFDWADLATNISAATGSITWESELFQPAHIAVWKVTSATDTNIYDIAGTFPSRGDPNSGLAYFVNNHSITGNVFTTAPGSSANLGIRPDQPAASIQAVLQQFEIEGLDTIFMDTGVYPLTGSIVINQSDAGISNRYVLIRGSTNFAAGGTVLDRQAASSGTSVFRFEDLAEWIELRDLTLRQAGTGVMFDQVNNIRLVNVRSHGHGSAGFTLEQSSAISFDRCSIWSIGELDGVGIQNSQSSFAMDNSVIWSDFTAVNLNAGGGVQSFTNSVLRASGEGHRIFRMDIASTLAQIRGNYNNFLYENGAIVAEKSNLSGGNDIVASMVAWRRETGQGQQTLSHAPHFADALNGDFALRSTAGRYLLDGSLTNDLVHSPMIDTGDPAILVTVTNIVVEGETTVTNIVHLEPLPNGDRINMGNFGNTRFASLSQTNPWLLAISLNDGGTIGGTQRLVWASGNLTNGTLVRLEYSRNDGIVWNVIASNVVNTSTGFLWNVSAEPPLGFFGRWRVIWQDDPDEPRLSDQNDNPFAIKNNPIVVYVNDSFTNGDVYATAPCHPNNTGLSPGSPICDPVVALRDYPIGPGDIVYIDTGYYQLTGSMLLNELTRGVEGLPIRIQGSTNRWAGGTVIDRLNPLSPVMTVRDTMFVDIDHVKFTGGSLGLSVASTEFLNLTWVETFSNAQHGVSLSSVIGFTARNTVSWNNGGWGLLASTTPVTWESGVFWSNALGGVKASVSSIAIRNSIVHSPRPGSYLYEFSQTTFTGTDYNFLHVEPGAKLIRNAQLNVDLQNLQQFRRQLGGDMRSVLTNAYLVDPGAGDFHLQSQFGSFTNGTFQAQPLTSWAIDAGDPSLGFAEEQQPNGGRLNVGRYGNTHEASLSVTNVEDKALLAVSVMDGGLVIGETNTLLYWLSRGYTSNDTVRVEYTRDCWTSWHVITAGVPVTQSEIIWDSSEVDSSPIFSWRVVDEAEESIKSDVPCHRFVTGPTFFYVNDANTNGTLYTEGPGHPDNFGLEPALPNSSLENIFNRWDIIGGDVIYVDTGFYLVTNEIVITSFDSGVSTAKVTVVGSTNYSAGGSVLHGAHSNFAGSMILNLRQATHVNFENLILENADNPISLEIFSANNTFSNMLVRDGGSIGVRLRQSSNNRFHRTIITRHQGVGVDSGNASANAFIHSIIWSNAGHAVSVGIGNLWVSNSVLSASGADNLVYALDDVSVVRANFNNLYITNGARYGQFNNIVVQGLPQWIAATGEDVFSLSVDPMFADAANDDYHLRSLIGRYDPVSASWTNDTDHSRLIDTGAFFAPLGDEPAPNGGRINIGLHGGTTEASLSLSDPWLYAITASSGGRMGGIFRLAWAGGGMSATNRVNLDYSHDNGGTWTEIVYGQSLTNWSYLWDSTDSDIWEISPNARWRVSLESDTNVYHITDMHFGLNGPFTFYINVTNSSGDVYATAPGHATNFGTRPWIPKASLRDVLDTFDIDGEDQILIDTGVYPISTNELVVWERGDEGNEFDSVLLQGSTNLAGGGTVFNYVGPGVPALISLQGAFIEIRDVALVGAGFSSGAGDIRLSGLSVTNAGVTLAGVNYEGEHVRIIGGNLSSPATNVHLRAVTIGNGGATFSGANVLFENSIVYGGGAGSVALFTSADNTTIRNNTLVGGGSQFRISESAATALLENNILVANGADRFCIIWDGGAIASDYNNLVATNGAWIGSRNGQWENLQLWQLKSGVDIHSLSSDPLFANPAVRDYHLRSTVGRWTGSGFTNDAVHSPSIDAGNPLTPLTDEIWPHGFRVNQGAYGNTAEASLSQSNAWLQVVTMNDGGMLRDVATLRWLSGGMPVTNLVDLFYSPDGGSTWTNIASGILASDHEFIWDTTQVTSSLHALWRIELQDAPAVADETDSLFAVRNEPRAFYVNNASTNDNVYTIALGSALNDGLSPATPKISIQNILDAYPLIGNDVIYVDTGTYILTGTTPLRVLWSRSGDDSGNILIKGSTNYNAGGTILHRVINSADIFEIKGDGITLSDLTLQNANRGVLLDSNRLSVVERSILRNNTIGVLNQRTIGAINRNLIVLNSRFVGIDVSGGSLTTIVENITFVGNTNSQHRMQDGSQVNVSQNNIFYLTVTNSLVFGGSSGAVVNAFIDYNIYYFAETNGTQIALGHNKLQPWQLQYGKDFRSAVTNPLFADFAGQDFRVMSTEGRWDGTNWVMDAEHSWAIDKGNPFSDYSNEPPESGGRINIGAYGNTESASKGRTNVVVETRTINVLTNLLEDSQIPLIWTVNNVPTNLLVDVQFSGDNGLTWYNLATGISAFEEYIIWQNSDFYNTYGGRWRVIGEDDSIIYAGTNTSPFEIFFGEFAIRTNYQSSARMSVIEYHGAWGQWYRVQYSTNGLVWNNATSGSDPILENAFFLSTNGGLFVYRDIDSTNSRFRIYRVIENP